MAWLPIAYTVPQYFDPDTNQPYSGAVLKAYQVGTTTNIPFATTNEGTTTANSIALNASGYPEVGGNVVIPHLDQDYKLALYPDQASADADSGADWIVDDIDLIQTTDTATAADYNVWPLVDYGGAKFDGSNDYLTRGAGLTGASDGKKGTIVAFVTFDASATAIEYVVHSTGGAFILRRDADGVFRVIAENSGGSTILNMATSSAYNDTDTVYCVMASWDLATPGSNQLYVNDESDVATTTFTNDTIDYTVADWAVGADVGGANKITGNVLSVWLDATDNLDFDTELNRRRFLDEQDNPVYLGVQGELPTGTQPLLFLGNFDETEFEKNRGSGGDFTENGTLAAASVTFDGQFGGKGSAERFPNVNADVTATDEELNTLDGFTGATSDLNALTSMGYWTLIEKQTASSSSSLDFTTGIDSTHTRFMFVISELVNSQSGALRARISTDGGSTWDSGASDYKWAYDLIIATTSNVSGTDTFMQVVGDGSETADGHMIFTRGSGSVPPVFEGTLMELTDSTHVGKRVWIGYRDNSAAIDGVQFFPESGSLSSGDVYLYGWVDGT